MRHRRRGRSEAEEGEALDAEGLQAPSPGTPRPRLGLGADVLPTVTTADTT